MSWRFRKSFKVLPGLRLNLSTSGLSVSIGGAPFTVNIGPKGVYGSASLPGTGLQFRQRLDASRMPIRTEPFSSLGTGCALHESAGPPVTEPLLETNSDVSGLGEIRSAHTERLTSDSLKNLVALIQTAHDERTEIKLQLSNALREQRRVTAIFESWDRGILLKRLFKNAFESRRIQAELLRMKVSELEEQLRLTIVSTQIDLADDQAEPFFRLRDQFASLAECAAIWDVKAEGETDKSRDRTIANKTVNREKVQFELGCSDLIQWQEAVPHLRNANGGDIFLYPGLILYRASTAAFSVIDFHDVEVRTSQCHFHEEDGVPNDSCVVGSTWAKTNKDGSRDKRFATNYEIPIVLYGELTLRSATGLHEKFHFSNPEPMERFAKAWTSFVTSFDHRVSLRETGAIIDAAGQAPSTPTTSSSHDICFECSTCAQPIAVNREAAGQEFCCPVCGQELFVPELLD